MHYKKQNGSSESLYELSGMIPFVRYSYILGLRKDTLYSKVKMPTLSAFDTQNYGLLKKSPVTIKLKWFRGIFQDTKKYEEYGYKPS